MTVTTQAKLTEARYLERRRELDASIAAAQAESDKAALQLELGAIGEDEFHAAEAVLSSLKARRNGLEAAWGETQRADDTEAQKAELVERREAARLLRQLEAKRVKEMAAVADILASLKPHTTALNKIESQLVATVQPFARKLADDPRVSGDVYSDYIADIRDRSRERAFAEGAVHHAGLFGLGIQFPGPMGDLDLLNRVKSIAIARIADRLSGGEHGEDHAD